MNALSFLWHQLSLDMLVTEPSLVASVDCSAEEKYLQKHPEAVDDEVEAVFVLDCEVNKSSTPESRSNHLAEVSLACASRTACHDVPEPLPTALRRLQFVGKDQVTVGMLLMLDDYRSHLYASLDQLPLWLQHLAGRTPHLDQLETFLLTLKKSRISRADLLLRPLPEYIWRQGEDIPLSDYETEDEEESNSPAKHSVEEHKSATAGIEFSLFSETSRFSPIDVEEPQSWTIFLDVVDVDALVEGNGHPALTSDDFNNGLLYALWRTCGTLNISVRVLKEWLSALSPAPLKAMVLDRMIVAAEAMHRHMRTAPQHIEQLRVPILFYSSKDDNSKKINDKSTPLQDNADDKSTSEDRIHGVSIVDVICLDSEDDPLRNIIPNGVEEHSDHPLSTSTTVRNKIAEKDSTSVFEMPRQQNCVTTLNEDVQLLNVDSNTTSNVNADTVEVESSTNLSVYVEEVKVESNAPSDVDVEEVKVENDSGLIVEKVKLECTATTITGANQGNVDSASVSSSCANEESVDYNVELSSCDNQVGVKCNSIAIAPATENVSDINSTKTIIPEPLLQALSLTSSKEVTVNKSNSPVRRISHPRKCTLRVSNQVPNNEANRSERFDEDALNETLLNCMESLKQCLPTVEYDKDNEDPSISRFAMTDRQEMECKPVICSRPMPASKKCLTQSTSLFPQRLALPCKRNDQSHDTSAATPPATTPPATTPPATTPPAATPPATTTPATMPSATTPPPAMPPLATPPDCTVQKGCDVIPKFNESNFLPKSVSTPSDRNKVFNSTVKLVPLNLDEDLSPFYILCNPSTKNMNTLYRDKSLLKDKTFIQLAKTEEYIIVAEKSKLYQDKCTNLATDILVSLSPNCQIRSRKYSGSRESCNTKKSSPSLINSDVNATNFIDAETVKPAAKLLLTSRDPGKSGAQDVSKELLSNIENNGHFEGLQLCAPNNDNLPPRITRSITLDAKTPLDRVESVSVRPRITARKDLMPATESPVATTNSLTSSTNGEAENHTLYGMVVKAPYEGANGTSCGAFTATVAPQCPIYSRVAPTPLLGSPINPAPHNPRAPNASEVSIVLPTPNTNAATILNNLGCKASFQCSQQNQTNIKTMMVRPQQNPNTLPKCNEVLVEPKVQEFLRNSSGIVNQMGCSPLPSSFGRLHGNTGLNGQVSMVESPSHSMYCYGKTTVDREFASLMQPSNLSSHLPISRSDQQSSLLVLPLTSISVSSTSSQIPRVAIPMINPSIPISSLPHQHQYPVYSQPSHCNESLLQLQQQTLTQQQTLLMQQQSLMQEQQIRQQPVSPMSTTYFNMLPNSGSRSMHIVQSQNDIQNHTIIRGSESSSTADGGPALSDKVDALEKQLQAIKEQNKLLLQINNKLIMKESKRVRVESDSDAISASGSSSEVDDYKPTKNDIKKKRRVPAKKR